MLGKVIARTAMTQAVSVPAIEVVIEAKETIFFLPATMR